MPAATDVETLDDIDEALRHLSLVPEADRGPGWHAYSDALLERRSQMDRRPHLFEETS